MKQLPGAVIIVTALALFACGCRSVSGGRESRTDGREKMMKTIVSTDRAPAAVGPYSQAVKAAGLIFVSGQIPLTPEGVMAEGGIREQSRQALDNLRAVLEAAGASLDSVIKTNCYLQDMGDFAAFNEVYAGYFPRRPPARACVEAARLPRGVLVEIEAVALDSGRESK